MSLLMATSKGQNLVLQCPSTYCRNIKFLVSFFPHVIQYPPFLHFDMVGIQLLHRKKKKIKYIFMGLVQLWWNELEILRISVSIFQTFIADGNGIVCFINSIEHQIYTQNGQKNLQIAAKFILKFITSLIIDPQAHAHVDLCENNVVKLFQMLWITNINVSYNNTHGAAEQKAVLVWAAENSQLKQLTYYNHSHSYYGSSNIKVSDIKWHCLWEFTVANGPANPINLFFLFYVRHFYCSHATSFMSPFTCQINGNFFFRHLFTQL